MHPAALAGTRHYASVFFSSYFSLLLHGSMFGGQDASHGKASKRFSPSLNNLEVPFWWNSKKKGDGEWRERRHLKVKNVNLTVMCCVCNWSVQIFTLNVSTDANVKRSFTEIRSPRWSRWFRCNVSLLGDGPHPSTHAKPRPTLSAQRVPHPSTVPTSISYTCGCHLCWLPFLSAQDASTKHFLQSAETDFYLFFCPLCDSRCVWEQCATFFSLTRRQEQKVASLASCVPRSPAPSLLV